VDSGDKSREFSIRSKTCESYARMFILAGGKGERFFPFSSLIPKCLIPVAGKPCLRWIVEDAIEQGFADIVLARANENVECRIFLMKRSDLVIWTESLWVKGRESLPRLQRASFDKIVSPNCE
jgi:CTP:molybdopterin cytidylyltransferase MocA